MKILISGICGFVGSALASGIAEEHPDWEVFGFDNFIRAGSELNRQALRRRGIAVVHADLRSATDMDALPAADFVIDAAANPSVLAGVDGITSSRQLLEHNLVGTLNLLEYCKRHRAGFILLSTSRVYSIEPLATLPICTESEAFKPDLDRPLPEGISALGVSERFSTKPPLSLYGTSKLASELLAMEYGATFDFPVWINRCGVLAGAGQFGRADQGIFSYWLHSWKQRRPLKYIGFNGLGYQTRDALHPSDLLPVLFKQFHTRNSGAVPQIVNLGGGVGQSCSLARLSAWCADRFGAHEVVSDPNPRPFDIPWMVMDSSLAKQTWNWAPQRNLESILGEIAVHTEENGDWLSLTAS